MSHRSRFDPLGLSELDSGLAADTPGLAFESPLDAMAAVPPALSGRIASRRAFVEMKQLFMLAVENLAHRKAAWLRAQVRAAEDPADLWLLRGPLLSALREDDLATRTLRAALYRLLDRSFPPGLAGAGSGTTALRPRA